MNWFKYILSKLSGAAKAFYEVAVELLTPTANTTVKEAAHHIMIFDRSGSMYSQMEDVKSCARKLMTLEEFRDENLKFSLLSYSSAGDLTLHFQNVLVKEIMKAGSTYLQKIEDIRATGLTCISQALREAQNLIVDGEVTCITLHSDGFANHPSYYSENQSIQEIVDELKTKPGVFCNTICHTRYGDFQLLNKIASELSGTCLQALSVKEIYQALHDTTVLVAKNSAPAMSIQLNGADHMVVTTSDTGKVLGASDDILIQGLSVDDKITVYRFTEQSKTDWDQSTHPNCVEGDSYDSVLPILALARDSLSRGQITTAKQLVFSSLNQTLWEDHSRALSGTELASFASDLEDAIFTDNMESHYFYDDVPVEDGTSILEVAALLNEHAVNIEIEKASLQSGYKRQSVKRIPGRIRRGVYEELDVGTEMNDGDYIQLSSVDANNSTATLQLKTISPISLVRKKGDKTEPITKVASVDLTDLKTFRNWTWVSSGVLQISELQVRIKSKKAFRALERVGLVDGPWEPQSDYQLDFSYLPLVNHNQEFKSPNGTFERLAKVRTLTQILEACLKGQSADLTAEQIADLKEVGVSSSLGVNLPTVYEFLAEGMSRQEAMASGKIDTRVTFEVQVGTTEVLRLKRFPSANKMLKDFFQVVGPDGCTVKTPKFQELFLSLEDCQIQQKNPAKKIPKPSEGMVLPLFREVLGLEDNGAVIQVLKDNGLDQYIPEFQSILDRSWKDTDEAVEILPNLKRVVKAKVNRIFQDQIRPLVFYVGSSGCLPDELDVPAITAEDLQIKYPNLRIAKDEKEGNFFELGSGTILSVYPKEVAVSR